MKAVVVELKRDCAAVLSDDGRIVAVKNDNYEIGQIIQIRTQKLNITKKLTVLAASAAALVFLSAGAWAYASPYTYVSIDVNPSIEYTVNRFDRVIKVKAANDDGEELLNEIPLRELTNKSIENAVKTTVEQLSAAGYLDGEAEDSIIIATSSEGTGKADKLAEQLQTSVEEVNQENGASVAVETFSVEPERVREARELGVTPGKLNLIEKLKEAAGDSAEVNIDEWLDKPVKEIMQATKEYQKASEDQKPQDSQDDSGRTGSDKGQKDQKEENKAVKEAENEQKDTGKETRKEQRDAAKDGRKDQKDTSKQAHKDQKEAAKDDHKDQKNASKDDHKGRKDISKQYQKDQKDTSKDGDKSKAYNDKSAKDNRNTGKRERDTGASAGKDKNHSGHSTDNSDGRGRGSGKK